jgi:hypothetical protein
MVHKSKIVVGLKDAVRYARGGLETGKAYRVEVPRPTDVRAIRAALAA